MIGLPRTPSSKINRANPSSTPGGSRVTEENILVTVRMRPLNSREHAKYDLIAWDCPDDHTIVFKNPNPERAAAKYSFGIFHKRISLLFLSLYINLLIIN